jgi:hypothetical protein
MAWSAVSRQHRLVYSLPDSAIVIDDFRIPEHWPRGYGLVVRWGTASAIWGALDLESDVLYLFDEYSQEAESAVHAAAIRARNDWIPGLIDPQANGRSQVDERELVQNYRHHRLALQWINSALESGVMNLRDRMHIGRLKVFASLSGFLAERRLYRCDEKGQIVNEHNSMMDAARCLIGGLSKLRRRPVPPAPLPPAPTGERSWMVRLARMSAECFALVSLSQEQSAAKQSAATVRRSILAMRGPAASFLQGPCPRTSGSSLQGTE